MSTDPIVEQIEHLPKTWSPEAGAVEGEAQTSTIPPTPAPPTTTTVATVTTTTTPAAGAIPWYKSQRFVTLVQSTVLWVLAWLISALSTNDWAWRAMAIGVGTNVLIVLRDWWSPTIVAPFAALNKGNNTIPAEKL